MSEERDFIVDLIEYALLDDLLKKIKQAKPNKENIVNIRFSSYDLEQLIGNLSLEANHNKSKHPVIHIYNSLITNAIIFLNNK